MDGESDEPKGAALKVAIPAQLSQVEPLLVPVFFILVCIDETIWWA